jgi:hypothetical protein
MEINPLDCICSLFSFSRLYLRTFLCPLMPLLLSALKITTWDISDPEFPCISQMTLGECMDEF